MAVIWACQADRDISLSPHYFATLTPYSFESWVLGETRVHYWIRGRGDRTSAHPLVVTRVRSHNRTSLTVAPLNPLLLVFQLSYLHDLRSCSHNAFVPQVHRAVKPMKYSPNRLYAALRMNRLHRLIRLLVHLSTTPSTSPNYCPCLWEKETGGVFNCEDRTSRGMYWRLRLLGSGDLVTSQGMGHGRTFSVLH